MPPSLWDNLITQNLAVTPDFLEKSEVSTLRGELTDRRARGKFRAAAIGKTTKSPAPTVRGDEIDWWDPLALTPVQKVFYDRLMGLAEAFNQQGYLGIHDLELHYAVYPAGARYARHVDRFRDDDRRVLSFICYLNESWQAAWGGELVCYPPDATSVAISPQGGTLVLFFSEHIPHEVLPPARERLSVTGWFRRRAI